MPDIFARIRASLSAKINLAIAVVIGATLLGFGLIDATRIYTKMSHQEAAAIVMSGERLAHELAVPLHDYDRDQIVKAVTAAMQDRNIVGIVVRDAVDGSVIYGAHRQTDWQGIEEDLTGAPSAPGAIAAPIELAGKPLGRISLETTDRFVRENVWAEIVVHLSAVAVVLVLMVLALIFAIRRHVLAPLLALQQTVERVADGDLSTAIDADRADEIGSLGKSFARMRDAIRDQLAALAASNQSLRTTLDSIGDGVVATDAAGLIVRFNPVACLFTGYGEGEAVGRPLTQIVRLASGANAVDLSKVMQTIAVNGWVAPRDTATELLARDGRRRPIEGRGALIRGAAGEDAGAVLVFRDMTDVREMQVRLLQAEKMQAMGQLAGGIAHDFNNLLTPILGLAEILGLQLAESPALAAHAGTIRRAGHRAADLTRQLLTFSRRQPLVKVEIDANVIVRHVVDVLARSIDKRIEIHQSLSAPAVFIMGDPSSLENALLNLGLNARDAMPAAGVLTFATKLVALDADFCTQRAPELEPGVYVEIDVADTGTGIDAAILPRLFEPFFTTKPQGEGTGLGLASVFGCVKSHGGALEIDSEVGRGSTFRLFIPAAGGKAAAAVEAPAALVRGRGRVLVVDDEEGVRIFVAAALVELGYDVVTCADGIEALARVAADEREFDVFILDLMMPKLSGEDTLRRLKALRPEVRVLIASGYASEETVRSVLALGGTGFISKPFTVQDLSRKLRDCLPG